MRDCAGSADRAGDTAGGGGYHRTGHWLGHETLPGHPSRGLRDQRRRLRGGTFENVVPASDRLPLPGEPGNEEQHLRLDLPERRDCSDIRSRSRGPDGHKHVRHRRRISVPLGAFRPRPAESQCRGGAETEEIGGGGPSSDRTRGFRGCSERIFQRAGGSQSGGSGASQRGTDGDFWQKCGGARRGRTKSRPPSAPTPRRWRWCSA